MVDRATTVCWRAVLADMLDAPIAELPVGNNVNAIEDLGDARTLSRDESVD